ncbi:NYN domain-containing protein [Cellulomonas sp. PhB150]|uniref:NYN domain-containing protein n=1 Tax=Cellulomonas sp. PhB150 TaxID=2485188 RepID=UPI000F4A999D|nr:NYN domain-containing protein [Cellulomonas sp. PhB150]ROS30900.1 putative RNA-binding protein with PIN domain [Cellulomonas sp. PhB150]
MSAAHDGRDVPDVLRAALVQAASEVLGRMEPVEVPTSLRAVAKFTPRKRAATGAAPLWSALHDEPFRARVAREWATGRAAAGDEEPTSLVVAVGAWLRGTDEWRGLVVDEQPPAPPVDERLERTREELARAQARADAAVADARAARDELAGSQREMRRLRSDADRARSEGRRAADEARAALEAARADREVARAERDRAAEDRGEAEAVRTAARAESRVARKLADARVRLLLDTVVDAASGLRAELALAPVADLPADLVAPEPERVAGQRGGSRGRSLDDPALLDEVLRQPWAHLVVDGYNVSKTGFGTLALDEQRRRLVDGLAVVAARTGAEVTCCFDGQEGSMPSGGLARGVRVRFSVGEIADDLIRRLVRAEPAGRVVVVVTSDQAVARDVEATGAWVVPAATLVARLNRV